MAQHDFNIANQSFPSFRTDLNNALSAINTSQSGTSRPSGAVAGTIWLDTTSATTPTLKYYDGADDISLATLDHSANTVNWLDSTVSITGLSTTATGTVLTLTDSVTTSTVNLIIDNQKEIRFRETTANGTNYVALKAPASVSADLTFTLPATDGTSGQVLQTNGSGVLSFATPSSGTNTPIIYARATTATNIANDTFTKITLDDEIIDTNGVFASSRFTATTAGKYLIIGEVSVNMSNATAYCATSIYKNGVEIHVNLGKSNKSSVDTVNGTASIITSLSVSDYIELYSIHNNGSSVNTNTGIYTGLSITKLIE
jgi:hypothetical protein